MGLHAGAANQGNNPTGKGRRVSYLWRCQPHFGAFSLLMSAIFDNLLYDLDAASGILTITINRPTKLNALNAATITELGQAIDQARADADRRRHGRAGRRPVHAPRRRFDQDRRADLRSGTSTAKRNTAPAWG